MVQSFRSDLRPLPLRRGIIDTAKSAALVGIAGVAAFLTLEHHSGGLDTLLPLTRGDGGMTTATDADIPEAAANENLEIVRLNGETLLNETAQAFLFPSVMSVQRQVVLHRLVDVTSLLGAGEVMPPLNMMQVFIASRAARLADAECARLTRHVAEECSLASAGVVQIAEEASGTVVEITLTLNFTPRTATGELPDTEAMQFATRTVAAETVPDGISQQINADQTGGSYLDFIYADAEAACAEVRRTSGNCSIMRIDAEAAPFGKSSGTFTLAWMVPAQQIAEDQQAKPAG